MECARLADLLAPFLGDALLSDTQLSQFSAYLDLLLRWNARINLTAVRDPERIVPRHFGESLFTARHLYPDHPRPLSGNWLLDLGSGAGFPGVPVKIWAPGLRLTLVESQYRKAIFLRELVRSLRLRDTDVFPGRAEDFNAHAMSTGEVQEFSRIVVPGAPAGASPGLLAANVTVTLRAVERFDAVLPTAARLLTKAPARSRRLALLIGAAQVNRARQILPGFTWSDPLAIPESSSRVLFLGSL